jgi:glycosyltransferase involved in cell wall biosynthesis
MMTAVMRDYPAKVKVLQIVTRLSISGTTSYVISLIRGLDQTQYQQELICGLEGPGERSARPDIEAQGHIPIVIPQLIGNTSLNCSDALAFAQILRLIRRKRPTIVHTHHTKAGLLGRLGARLSGVPIVIHTFHGLILKDHYGAVKTRMLRATERCLGKLSDRLVVISEDNQKDLLSYGVAAAEKIELIPLGFELDRFISGNVQRGLLHRELDLEPAIKLIGIVGRIVPIKNHRLFLEAAARLFARQATAQAIVVGDGNLRPEVESYARQLGIANRVAFLGWRHDLPQVYADLDVVVISSNNEGTPLSAIEAMAAGRPVVATKVGGLPDVISDSKTGYLVSPGNPEELAFAIERVLQGGETISDLVHNARRAVKDKFTIKRFASDMNLLYQRLLAEKGLEHSADASLGSWRKRSV